jgi:hypothetical protein
MRIRCIRGQPRPFGAWWFALFVAWGCVEAARREELPTHAIRKAVGL